MEAQIGLAEIIFGTLGLGMFYIVLKRLELVWRHRKCVEDEVMNEYREGRLKEGQPDYEHLIAHLGNCEKCRDKMTQF